MGTWTTIWSGSPCLAFGILIPDRPEVETAFIFLCLDFSAKPVRLKQRYRDPAGKRMSANFFMAHPTIFVRPQL